MSDPISLVPNTTSFADDLRTLADELDAGTETAHTATIVMRDRIKEEVRFRDMGELQTTSQRLGMLMFAMLHIYYDSREL